MGFIYKITSPSNRLYIGQTYEVKQRIDNYRALRHRSKKSIIIWSIKKYGWAAHKFEIIEEVEDSMMDEREIFWIAELKTFYPTNLHGMNLTLGGGGVRQSWKHDVERVAKAKLRCGEKAPRYGKSPSKEQREKIAVGVSKYNRTNGVKPLSICYEILRKKQSLPVLCYDLTGNFISEYESITFAAKVLGIDRKTANDALNGKQKHGGGYLFRKKLSDEYPKNILPPSKIELKGRKILSIFNEEMLEFDNMQDAADYFDVCKDVVQRSLSTGKISRSGYFFIYKDKYQLIQKLIS